MIVFVNRLNIFGIIDGQQLRRLIYQFYSFCEPSGHGSSLINTTEMQFFLIVYIEAN